MPWLVLVAATLSGVAVAALPPRVEALVAELLRPGCPNVFDQLTPSFQQEVPRERWSLFCQTFSGHGEVRSIVRGEDQNGFMVFYVTLGSAAFELKVDFDDKGRLRGLFSRPWDAAKNGAPVAESKTRFRWPLTKPTLVAWGGSDAASNRHVGVPRQRRATDLNLVRPDGQRRSGSGKSNADYDSFGADVVAAADGRVLVVVDGIPDNDPGVMDDTLVPGNVISIEHAPGEFAHYCHLKQGSTRVKPGERVKAGQVIGLVGNSGNSSQPHLHFHVQDSPRMAEGLGIEPLFSGVCVRQGRAMQPVPLYRLNKGDVVAPCDAAAGGRTNNPDGRGELTRTPGR